MKEHDSLISISPLRRKSRAVIQASIFKPQITATLQWLNLPPEPRHYNRPPSHPLLSPFSDLLKKFLYLIVIFSTSIPLVTLLRRTRSPFRKTRSMIIDIEPLGLPIPNLTAQSIQNILLRHARTKLKVSTSYPSSIPRIGKWIKGKQTLEKVKVGMYSKESFAQLDKNGYMQN